MSCFKSFVCFCFFIFLVAESFAQDWQSIWNGVYWYDINGNTLEAHGGGFIKIDDTYYWFGEDKSHNSHHFKAVNCYSSKDLANWEFRNAVLTPGSHPDLNVNGRVVERPKVVYNETTGEFVMWMHWESSDYGAAECGVAMSATIDGDYELVKHFRPNNNMSRDCTLFKDDDGTAYFISAANENADLIIYELTDDYLDIQRQVVTLWRGGYREAPAVVKADGIYYLFSSGCTGWDPNQAKYATASSMDGPWSNLKNIGNETTFDSQSTYVLPIAGSDTSSYIFCADRWKDPDLKNSKYIWLPLHLNNGNAVLSWKELWQINTRTGEWGQGHGEPPAMPGNLNVKKNSATRIELAWDDISDNEAGFELEQRRGTRIKTTSIGRNSTSQEVIALLPGKKYTFRIRAINSAGYSDYSPDLNVTTASAISDSLILHLQFETGSGDVAVDGSAYQNDVSLRMDPNWVEGYKGRGLEFDGVSAYVDLGDNEYFDLQEGITVSAWIKQYDAANGQHNPWITKGDHTFGLKHYAGNSYQFFIHDNGWYSVDFPSSAQDNNKWRHFAGTYDGEFLVLYIDGQMQGSRSHTGFIDVDPSYHVNLGRNSELPDRLFNGVMDEVKLFNVALTEEEVGQLYNEVFTAVEDLLDDAQPRRLVLHQNYPNPFNTDTRIIYEVAEYGKVSLSVYNLMGQKQATLIDEMKETGVYSIDFDASVLSSGTYIVALKTGSRSIYRKMTMLK
jgi:hypothetical protein